MGCVCERSRGPCWGRACWHAARAVAWRTVRHKALLAQKSETEKEGQVGQNGERERGWRGGDKDPDGPRGILLGGVLVREVRPLGLPHSVKPHVRQIFELNSSLPKTFRRPCEDRTQDRTQDLTRHL